MRKFILTSVVGGFMATSLMAQGFGTGFPKGTTLVPANQYKPVPIKNGTVVPPNVKPIPSTMQQPFVTQQTIVKPIPQTKPPVTLVTKPPVVPVVKPLIQPISGLSKPPVIQPISGLSKPPVIQPISGVTKPPLFNTKLGKEMRFVLPDKTNQDLSKIPGTGRVDPITEASLAKAMSGESLSQNDRLLLTTQMFNGNLQPHEKAAISKALQEDLKEKQQMVSPPTVIVPQPFIPHQPPVVFPPSVIVPPAIIHNPPAIIHNPPVVIQPQPLVVQPPMGGSGSDIDTATPTAEYGLLIKELGATGAAQEAGLAKGDIIVMVGGQRVQSFEAMSALVAQVKGTVEVMVYREGQLAQATVTPKAGKMGVAVDVVAVK